MADSVAIGNRIRDMRKKKGLMQTELADHIGVSAACVGGWERGEYSPQADKLQGLADLFGVTPAYISLGIEEDKPVIVKVPVAPPPRQSAVDVPPVERKMFGAAEPIKRNVKDKENLRLMDVLIKHLPDMRICTEDKKDIYRMICAVRTDMEIRYLFGEGGEACREGF